jgi:NAD(P)-dependent dehydrogenase (short-subunit alcohol dehydrogenase family)
MAVQAQTLTQLKERLNQDLFDLRGRVAIVTGGSSGIGKAMAAGLAHYGARVAIAGSNPGKCEVAADELRRIEAHVLPLPTDVSDPDQARSLVERTVNEWGRLDILINSAGVYQGVSAFEMSVAEWRRVMAVDLDGAFYCCQAAGRAMVETGRGSIINITSLSGLLGYANEAAYCAAKGGLTMLTRALAAEWAKLKIRVNAAKGGLTMLTRALAAEWAKLKIRVNAIAPTWFYSPISAHILDDPKKLAEKLRSIPLERVGHGDDIVGAAVFLASDASNFITGQILTVDGGKFALLGEW